MATDELADSFADVLAAVQRLSRRRLRHGLSAPPLRGAQVELLRLVVARPGIGVSAAARDLRLAGNSVSTLVNQLVKAGLLRRETDPSDRRSALLYATPAAAARLSDWQVRRGTLMREQLAALDPADRAALAAALPALRKLADNLHEDRMPVIRTEGETTYAVQEEPGGALA
ncbi:MULTISPECIES: MarR family winged helix-turn-helix transcriptional regulator [unclassified Streptomyces]|uniref:MarR family winged helix-turn-helix transcriptional regulator n=1 Tax=unclassified Streptomyces TaxID=2593676 RepID=UPI002254768D|nr:MarR family transcriptional regulator [Streptomyces sp. NBC_00063]MCX5442511.1 MarR family transcriptional regulator [Streptomyces sp. NBC_00063]